MSGSTTVADAANDAAATDAITPVRWRKKRSQKQNGIIQQGGACCAQVKRVTYSDHLNCYEAGGGILNDWKSCQDQSWAEDKQKATGRKNTGNKLGVRK